MALAAGDLFVVQKDAGGTLAKVTAQDLKEGTLLYSIRALMPVVESLSSWAPLDSPAREVNAGVQHQVRGMKMIRESFSDELRKRTSGVGSAQLSFSHWAEIDADPFWVPTTEEVATPFSYDNQCLCCSYVLACAGERRFRRVCWMNFQVLGNVARHFC